MLLFAASVLLIALPGCGPRLPETAPVSGRVTVNGEPVTEGKIIFYPEEGRPGMSEIAEDGTYRLTTFREHDGAVLGIHRVTIKSTRVTGTPAPRTFEEELEQARGDEPISAAVVEWIVPQEYARRETTPLERTVTAGENHFDFEIDK